ncbi:MAG: glycoside hydrolase family 97 protein [Trueperaceae bacterium]
MKSPLRTTLITSPDKHLSAQLSWEQDRLELSVSYQDEPVLSASKLGLAFADESHLEGPFVLIDMHTHHHDETWHPVLGQYAEIQNHYHEVFVVLEEQIHQRRRLGIRLRVFDDGLAFRYELNKTGVTTLTDELTEFRFPRDHTAYVQPLMPETEEVCELPYEIKPLSQVREVNTPVTLRTQSGLYIALHEANLTNYSSLTFQGQEKMLSLKSVLPKSAQGIAVQVTGDLQTPWRTLHVAKDAGGLLGSSLLLNLNEPCALENTSWIKPLKYVGPWWDMHLGIATWAQGEKHAATTDNVKRYIDFAAAKGVKGVLVEGWNTGWDTYPEMNFSYTESTPDFDLAHVAAYAKTNNIELILSHATFANLPLYENQLESAFALLKKLGLRYFKTGYFGPVKPTGLAHQGQGMVEHQRRVLELAAKNELMVEVHEAVMPSGLERTYPNLLTSEAVRGNEYNGWSEGNTPQHDVIVPFVRGLAGPLAYTPGIFDLTYEGIKQLEKVKASNDIEFDKIKVPPRVHTTLCKQLALFVVYFSPSQMLADRLESYEGHPAFAFLRNVPTLWDDTRYPHGEIGEFITVARRSGQSWFIGSITNEKERTLELSLDFLEANISYEATLYTDTPETHWQHNPSAYKIDNIVLRKGDTLTLQLAPGGGCAVSLFPNAERLVAKADS